MEIFVSKVQHFFLFFSYFVIQFLLDFHKIHKRSVVLHFHSFILSPKALYDLKVLCHNTQRKSKMGSDT